MRNILMAIGSLLLSTTGCSANSGKPSSNKKYLVSAELKNTATAASLKNSYSPAAGFIKNGYTATASRTIH